MLAGKTKIMFSIKTKFFWVGWLGGIFSVAFWVKYLLKVYLIRTFSTPDWKGQKSKGSNRYRYRRPNEVAMGRAPVACKITL